MATISSSESGQPITAVPPPTLVDIEKVSRSSATEESHNSEKKNRAASSNEVQNVQEAASKISDFVSSFSHDLEFSVDNSTHKVVIKVKVRDSGEVVRQIPSEEALQIAKSLDTLSGLLIREHI